MFLDAEKCFDNLNWTVLFKVFGRYEFGGEFCKMNDINLYSTDSTSN